MHQQRTLNSVLTHVFKAHQILMIRQSFFIYISHQITATSFQLIQTIFNFVLFHFLLIADGSLHILQNLFLMLPSSKHLSVLFKLTPILLIAQLLFLFLPLFYLMQLIQLFTKSFELLLNLKLGGKCQWSLEMTQFV